MVEYLEPRLPPGDALLGILAGGSLFETGSSTQALVASAARLARTPNWAATSATIAEVAAFPDAAGSDFAEGRVVVARRQHRSDSEDAATHSWNDWLADPTQAPILAGRPQSPPAENRMTAESTPILSSPIGGVHAANPPSIPNGLSAIVVPPSATTPAADGPAKSEFRTPFYFEKNVGQAGEGLDYVARGTGYTLGLSATEAVMALPGSADTNLVRMQLVGGNSHATVAGVDPIVTKVNYFLGSDPDHWHTNIPTFGRVQYDDVYPGIDLVYYGNHGQLEYDFVVSPGADPNQIAMNFAGADGVEVNGDGDLLLHTAAGDVLQQAPLTYQEVGGSRQEVASRFVVDGNQVRFDLGGYDATRPLVIDPLVMGYSTYLGGGGQLDVAYGIAVDDNGYAYVVGETRSPKFPVTPGAFEETYNGGLNEAFVAKMNADGSELIYATFLGGRGEDQGRKIAVDANGNAYVTGNTRSRDFPVTPGAFQTSLNTIDGSPHPDAFVSKLSPDGSDLTYSTYLGGSGTDYGGDIAVDAAGRIHLTGSTNSTNFPVTPGAADMTYNGGLQDVFVAKLDPGTGLVYATYLGGLDNDVGFGVAVDLAGNVYVSGLTESMDFPTTVNAFDQTYSGETDGFIVKLTADGAGLAYATYLGGTDADVAGSVVADDEGNVYVAGGTRSVDFPVTTGAFDTQHNVIDGNDGFLTKLNPVGSGLVYSTFLSAGSEGAAGIALDGAGNTYVAGTAGSGLPTTPDAFQKTWQGSFDAFFMKLNSAGSALIYSTYLGGSTNSDIATAIALDVGGSAYVAGKTDSGNFPTTPNALKRRNRPSTTDGFVTKFAQM